MKLMLKIQGIIATDPTINIPDQQGHFPLAILFNE